MDCPLINADLYDDMKEVRDRSIEKIKAYKSP